MTTTFQQRQLFLGPKSGCCTHLSDLPEQFFLKFDNCFKFDFNLHFISVLYDKSNNQSFWSSNTSGNPDASLILQNDGNLIVQAKLTNNTIWSSDNPTGC